MLPRPSRFEPIAAYGVVLLTLVIFVLQFRTLYTMPVYDSVRWGGDETWLMREFGNQALHGVMSYPESFGGAKRTDGVLAGSMWVDAVIYGLPGALFFPAHDYVSVGRTVTSILALVLLLSIFYILRESNVSSLIAALATLLLVACQGFVWASHSARYDLLTGLALIWFCYYLAHQANPSNVRMFSIGIVGALMICCSRHLLLLGLAASLAFLYEQKVWKQPSRLWSWLGGSALGAVFLSGVYFLGAHEFSLFGRGGTEGSYTFVLNQIPIFRPFSRNVQVSNWVERFHLFERDAPGVLVLTVVAIIFGIGYRLSNRSNRAVSKSLSQSMRFWWKATILCTIVWLLAEGSRPYYLFHITPLLVLAGILSIDQWIRETAEHDVRRIIGVAILLLAIGLDIGRAVPNNILGGRIAQDQRLAINKFLTEANRSESHKARILLDVAGLDRALPDTARQILTLDMFQPPHETVALVNKLITNKIDYVILRSSPVSSPFEPGRSLLPHVLDSIGTVQDQMTGFFYDDGRSYDAPLSELFAQGFDTLKLYRLTPSIAANR